MDSLEERQKTFFANCAKNKTKGSEREEYEGIRKEYQKVNFLLLSETKAQILVNNMPHNLHNPHRNFSKYLRLILGHRGLK